MEVFLLSDNVQDFACIYNGGPLWKDLNISLLAG
jgi:hypothetical protein